MAVIDIDRATLDDLVGQEVPVERLEDEGSMLGILFEPGEDGTVEVEVEPNRPDLLSVEGVARALRGFLGIDTGAVEYPVEEGDVVVERDGPVKNVRRHIACARVTGLDLDQDALDSIITLQEKLTLTYGRKRAKIAIGLHDFDAVEPPIRYEAVEPDAVSFVPLGMDEELTLSEILEQHEKGQEYGWILDGYDRYPLIRDDTGTVLSFPPVINGVATEVDASTDDLFIDVTGTSREEVETALNIIVAALHERGGTIETVTVDGERFPDMEGDTMFVDTDYVRDISGLDDLSGEGMARHLEAMNMDATVDGDELAVEVPAYRADVMHAYDLIEDIVIGYGYDSIEPELPDVATIGGRSRDRVFTDRLRDIMVGTGAQECMTFILTNRADLFTDMDVAERDVVAMANPLTEDYAVVRDWLLPSLVEVLGTNQHNRYPQRLFEVGRCSVLDDDTPTGARDVRRLAYVDAGTDADFASVRGVVQSLARVLGLDLAVEEAEHGSFDDARCGTVLMDGEAVGTVGMLSDTVREAHGIEVPVGAFELDVDAVQDLVDA